MPEYTGEVIPLQEQPEAPKAQLYEGPVVPLEEPKQEVQQQAVPYEGPVLPLDSKEDTGFKLPDIVKKADTAIRGIANIPNQLASGLMRGQAEFASSIPAAAVHAYKDIFTDTPKDQLAQEKQQAMEASMKRIDQINDLLPQAVKDLFPNVQKTLTGETANKLLAYPISKPLELGQEAITEKYGAAAGERFNTYTTLGMAALMAAPAIKGAYHTTGDVVSAIREGRKVKAETEAALKTATDNLATKIDEAMPTKNKYVPEEGKSYDAAFNDLRTNGGTLDNLLDTITEHSQATPHEKALARTYARVTSEIGLDGLEVAAPEADMQGGKYSLANDRVTLGKSPNQIKTALHEATHAIQSGMIDWYRSIANGHNIPDPVKRSLWLKVDAFQRVYETALEKVAHYEGYRLPNDKGDVVNFKKALLDVVEKHKRREVLTDAEKRLGKRYYGLSDFHEFGAEIMTNKEFMRIMKDFKLEPQQVAAMKVKDVRPVKGMWDEFRKETAKETSGKYGQSILEIAQDHATNLIDTVSPEMRTFPANDTVRSNSREYAKKQNKATDKFSEDTNHIEKAALQKLASILSNARSFEVFATRVAVDPFFKHSPEFVAKNLKRIWENPKALLRLAEKDNFKDYTPAEKEWMSDTRSIDQFWAEENPTGEIPKSPEDLGKFGTWIFNPTNIGKLKGNTLAGKVIRWWNSKLLEYASLKERLFEAGTMHLKEFNELSRKDRRELYDVMQKYNTTLSRIQYFRPNNLQWITSETLKKEGMSEKQISAYRNWTKAMDFGMDLINQTRATDGLPPLEPIPGYLSNIHEGAFKVLVRMTSRAKDDMGHPVFNKVVELKGYTFRQQAEAYVKSLEEGTRDNSKYTFTPVKDKETGLPYRIVKHGDIGNSLSVALDEHMEVYRNQLLLEPAVIQILENVEKNSASGFLKHELERMDVGGYLGEKGTNKGLLERIGIGSPENTRMLNQFQDYLRKVTDHYGNVMFQHEVYQPLLDMQPLRINGSKYYGEMIAKLPQLNRYLRESNFNFTGENLNKMNVIDDALQDMSIRVGISPHWYRSAVREIRNFMSLVALRANLRNYASNLAQPANTMALLEMMNVERAREGLKTFDSSEAFLRGMKKYAAPDRYTAEALQWLNDMHFRDPKLEDSMHTRSHRGPLGETINKVTSLGDLNAKIEEVSKGLSFSIALQHTRELYPKDPIRARETAAQVMRMAMIDYNRPQRPLMYTNTGVVGDALAPFAIFRNGMAGNTLNLFQTLLKDPLKAESYKPLIMQQLIYWSLAGVKGMVLFGEISMLLNLANKAFPEWELPTLDELLMKASHVAEGTPFDPYIRWIGSSANMSGPVSAATNINMSNSSGAVSLDDLSSMPMLDFMAAMKTLGLGTAKTLLSTTGMVEPATKEDLWKGRNAIPGILRYPFEKALVGDTDVAQKTNDLTGYVKRSEGDKWIAMLSGAESTDLTRQKLAVQVEAQIQKRREELSKDLVKLAANNQKGIKINTLSLETIAGRWVALNPNSDIKEFYKAVADRVAGVSTTQKQKIIAPLTGDAVNRIELIQRMEQR